jgi:TetR/AcrR family transcriptional repressor of nem operon
MFGSLKIELDRTKTTGHIEAMGRASVKEQIIDAAVEALHQKGFNGTSVKDITDAAQVPKGSFYNHFESKEALAVEAIDRYWQKVSRSLAELSDPGSPPVARLKSYFSRLDKIAQSREFHTGCLIGNISAEMADQSELVRTRLGILFAAWSRAIELCVREAQANGSIRRDIEAGAISLFLLNSWEGALMRSKVDRDRAPLEAFEQVVFISLAP